MTDDISTADYAQLVESLIAKHGPALTALDTEVIGIVAKMLVQVRTADAADVPKIASTIAQLQATLPTPTDASDDDFQLSRLSSSELVQLQKLQDKACNVDSPAWCVDDDIPPSPEITQRERSAAALARWVNERAAGWAHGGLSKCSALEINHLRSELNDITSPIPCRHIWRDVFMQDVEGMIEDAVRKALAAVGSDAKVVAPTPAEHEPFKQISIHDHPLAPVKNGPGT